MTTSWLAAATQTRAKIIPVFLRILQWMPFLPQPSLLPGLEMKNCFSYGPLIQDNPDEPVLSQRRDLLEQPLDLFFMSRMSFLLLSLQCQSTTGKPSGLVVFCFTGIVISTPCLTSSVKTLKEGFVTGRDKEYVDLHRLRVCFVKVPQSSLSYH